MSKHLIIINILLFPFICYCQIGHKPNLSIVEEILSSKLSSQNENLINQVIKEIDKTASDISLVSTILLKSEYNKYHKQWDVQAQVKINYLSNYLRTIINKFELNLVLEIGIIEKEPNNWSVSDYDYKAISPIKMVLSKETDQVLKNLNRQLTAKFFYKTQDINYANIVKILLDEYISESSFFHYDIINADENHTLTKKYGIIQYNTLLLSCEDKEIVINDINEISITEAIKTLIKITNSKKKVCFLEGHNEKSILSKEKNGYSDLLTLLNKTFDVGKINMNDKKLFSDSCEILIIGGPTNPLSESEVDKILYYLNNSGKLILLLDPESTSSLNRVLTNFNLSISKKEIIDKSDIYFMMGSPENYVIVNKYNNKHPITSNMNILSYFIGTTNISENDSGIQNTDVNWLIKTDKKVSYDMNQDFIGPLSIGVIASNQNNSNLIVIGDSDFLTNQYVNTQGNYLLFRKILIWLYQNN